VTKPAVLSWDQKTTIGASNCQAKTIKSVHREDCTRKASQRRFPLVLAGVGVSK
jgi:hypothetical protein